MLYGILHMLCKVCVYVFIKCEDVWFWLLISSLS